MSKTGIFLINLGTPGATTVASVRRYLRQFLSDPRVIDINPVARFLLLNLFILPFRPKKSTEAYRKIWKAEGSPLLLHTSALQERLQQQMGDEVVVRFGMRYQRPTMQAALEEFRRCNVERLVVMPLYPQYASSSTGSSLEELYQLCAKDWNMIHLQVVPPFYKHPAYIDAITTIASDHLGDLDNYDHYLISFHGLPERQIKKTDRTGRHCLNRADCCEAMCEANRFCYRAQSYETARLLARRLGLSEERYTVAFQSRLGRSPWIRPFTDEELVRLPSKGVKRLAVLIPSFTADCLETLEEIDIRGRESFLGSGGETYCMVPSLNSHEAWLSAVTQIVREALTGT